MELVPILSTIILVGTIATFILAVFAYILYKIREGKSRDMQYQSAGAMQEPHVLMTPQQQPMGTLGAPAPQPAPATPYMAPTSTMPPPQQMPYMQPDMGRMAAPQAARIAPPAYQPARPPQPAAAPNSLFWEYTDEGFVPVNTQRSTAQTHPQEVEDDGFAWL